MGSDKSFTTALSRKNGRGEEHARFETIIRMAAEEFHAASPFGARGNVKEAIERVAAQFNAMALKNPDIYGCTPASIGRCIHLCAMTGLLPGGPAGQVDVIPRKDKDRGVLELQWQIGWRGYVALGARTGRRVKVTLVFEGDLFEHVEGLDEVLRHIPAPEHESYWTWPGLVAAYAVVRDIAHPADRDFTVLYKQGIEKRRKLAQTQKIWNEWPMEMALKTIVRYAGQRGLIVLDDVGSYAMSNDMVFEREEPAPRVTTAKRGVAAQLADYDVLGQEDADIPPERELAPVGDGGIEDLVKPQPQADVQPAPEPEVEVDPVRAATDGLVLREKLGDWKTPLTQDQVHAALKGALGVSRLKPLSRLQQAIDYGCATWGWRVVNDRLLPALGGPSE